MSRSKPLGLVAGTCAALLALPAAAPAAEPAASPGKVPRIIFSKGSAISTANPDGSGAHQIATGSSPILSPDGGTVAYTNAETAKRKSRKRIVDVLVVPAAGGTPRLIDKQISVVPKSLVSLRRAQFDLNEQVLVALAGTAVTTKWAADSHHLAISNDDHAYGGLVVYDLANGTSIRPRSGPVGGASFSPDSTSLAFVSERGDINVLDLASGSIRRLGGSVSPFGLVWGPSAIAASSLGLSKLAVANPAGGGPKFLSSGSEFVSLLGWSPDGASLIATGLCLVSCSEDLVIFALDPASGSRRVLRKLSFDIKIRGRSFELNFEIPLRISQDAGSVLLARLDETLKLARGKPKPKIRLALVRALLGSQAPPVVLVAGASSGDWNL